MISKYDDMRNSKEKKNRMKLPDKLIVITYTGLLYVQEIINKS